MGYGTHIGRIAFISVVAASVGSATIFSLYARGETPEFSFLKGRFLIQTEQRGEAWYVMPESGKRLYIGTPEKAFVRIREIATPVSFETIEKIPNAAFFKNISAEQQAQFNKTGAQYAGRILLQADRAPYDTWYVSPQNGLRYSLRTPLELFRTIQHQALGISDENIKKIPQLEFYEDARILKRETVSSKTTVLYPRENSPDIAPETFKLADAIIDSYRKNNNASGQLALVVINGIPMLLYPEYDQWFLFGNGIDGKTFNVINASSFDGRYINYVKKQDGTEEREPIRISDEADAYLYGLYVFDEQKNKTNNNNDGVTFVVRDSDGIATINLKILLSEKRYQGIQPSSFIELNSGNSLLGGADTYKDNESFYLLKDGELQRVNGADIATLNTWGAADGTSVIADQYGMFALDAAGEPYRIAAEYPDTLTFDSGIPYDRMLAFSVFSSDPRTGRVRRAKQNELAGYAELARGIYSKQGNVYTFPKIASEPVMADGADAESFTAWPNSGERFFTDFSRVYFYNGETLAALPSINATTFSYLGNSNGAYFVKDNDTVYAIPQSGLYDSENGSRVFKKIRDVDAKSLQILYSDDTTLVAKDNHSVYVGENFTPVSDADAASFHIVLTVEGIPFGRDQYNIFYVLPKNPSRLYSLAGVDPRTFQLKTVPIIEPAMNTLTYQGSGRLAYAHDDKWIWFYDDKAGGITVIKRAKSDEKVAPEDILEFARMYLTFFD